MANGDQKKTKTKDELSVLQRLTAGSIAGAIGKSTVAPFQRIQIMYQVNSGQQFNLRDGFRFTAKTIRDQGFFSLWRGNIANAGRSGPTNGIKFLSQSVYKNLLTDSKIFGEPKAARGKIQFTSGALSGVTTVVATFPLDLFRTRMAADKSIKNYADCCRKIYRTSGLGGFYHGVKAPVVGSIPHTGIAFWAYSELKHLAGIGEDDRNSNPLVRTACGFTAGLAGQTVTYPFSTIRRRMQMYPEFNAMGLVKAFGKVWAEEGWLGWYRAYSIHLFKGPIATGIAFMINDIIKNKMYEHNEKIDAEQNA